MPKAEVGTNKWLANKMKAKGLQRLRWFCQMCEKQCRDENGFKCHRMSEGHQRQMQVFMMRPGKYMDEFSKEFEATFMQLMRTRYCRTRVLANTVYCELIGDKAHVHMNSTIWVTLSEFVLYLERTGKCTVESTPRGWYLQYIDRERIEREKLLDGKRRAEVTAEIRRQKILEKVVQGAWESAKNEKTEEKEDDDTSFKREEGERVAFKLPNTTANPPKTSENSNENQSSISRPQSALSQIAKDRKKVATGAVKVEEQNGSKRKLTTLEKLMMEQESKKLKLASIKTETVDLESDDDREKGDFEERYATGYWNGGRIKSEEERWGGRERGKERDWDRGSERDRDKERDGEIDSDSEDYRRKDRWGQSRERESDQDSKSSDGNTKPRNHHLYSDRYIDGESVITDKEYKRYRDKNERRGDRENSRERKFDDNRRGIKRGESSEKKFRKSQEYREQTGRDIDDESKLNRIHKFKGQCVENEIESDSDEPCWLIPDLIVKVNNPTFQRGKYHKKKGRVLRVPEKYIGAIQMVESKDVIEMDQDMLETVIPSIGSSVKIVAGQYKCLTGNVISFNDDGETVNVDIYDTRKHGNLDSKGELPVQREVHQFEFNQICKCI